MCYKLTTSSFVGGVHNLSTRTNAGHIRIFCEWPTTTQPPKKKLVFCTRSGLFRFLQNLLSVASSNRYVLVLTKQSFLSATPYLLNYYRSNDLLWQEGFLLDFAQKKATDKFLRKFLIFSTYLFNERYLFDKIIKVYSGVLLWFTTRQSIYSFANIASTLQLVVFLIFNLILLLSTLVLVKVHFFSLLA